jgi:hypothetical protein
MSPAGKFASGIAMVGAALSVAAVIWWAILNVQVYFNTGMSRGRNVPCLLYTSDLCSLAVALCKGRHFLGIKWYSTGLIWAGLAALGGGLVLKSLSVRS